MNQTCKLSIAFRRILGIRSYIPLFTSPFRMHFSPGVSASRAASLFSSAQHDIPFRAFVTAVALLTIASLALALRHSDGATATGRRDRIREKHTRLC